MYRQAIYPREGVYPYKGPETQRSEPFKNMLSRINHAN